MGQCTCTNVTPHNGACEQCGGDWTSSSSDFVEALRRGLIASEEQCVRDRVMSIVLSDFANAIALVLGGLKPTVSLGVAGSLFGPSVPYLLVVFASGRRVSEPVTYANAEPSEVRSRLIGWLANPVNASRLHKALNSHLNGH